MKSGRERVPDGGSRVMGKMARPLSAVREVPTAQNACPKAQLGTGCLRDASARGRF